MKLEQEGGSGEGWILEGNKWRMNLIKIYDMHVRNSQTISCNGGSWGKVPREGLRLRKGWGWQVEEMYTSHRKPGDRAATGFAGLRLRWTALLSFCMGFGKAFWNSTWPQLSDSRRHRAWGMRACSVVHCVQLSRHFAPHHWRMMGQNIYVNQGNICVLLTWLLVCLRGTNLPRNHIQKNKWSSQLSVALGTVPADWMNHRSEILGGGKHHAYDKYV